MCSLWSLEHSRKQIKRGFGARSAYRPRQAPEQERRREVVPWEGMSPAIPCFAGAVAAPCTWLGAGFAGRLLRVNTSFQLDLHTPADPRMLLWNFSGIFTPSVFRPPVERLSWVRVPWVVRRGVEQVQAEQSQPLSLGLRESHAPGAWLERPVPLVSV